jgi:phenylacetate-CoA ligase
MNFGVLAKGAAHLIVKRYVGPFWIRRQWLKKTQWMNESELKEIQLKLLKKLVHHCYDTVPYYKTLMDQRGISVDSIKVLEDISLFPILTKNDVICAGKSIISTKYPKWLMRIAYTGGTTGTPLLIWRDLFSIGNNHAFFHRQKDWAGIGLRDKCAYLTGRLIAEPDEKTGCLYAYDTFMKELILSTYHLSVDTAREYAEVLKRYRIMAIDGYPSAVYLLAKTCLDFGIELRLQSVFTSSETLTESMRDTISKAFKCKVYDYYGSAERTCIIHTCEHGSYHIIPEYGLAELIPTDESNKDICRIIATGFWNQAMPLIRYEMGDTIIKSQEHCPCNRAYPMIKSIIGRKADVIKTPSGREFGAAILTHLLYGTNHIVESQIIQDALDHIIIKYVPSEQFSEEDVVNLQHLILRHLPHELKVDLREVAVIKRTDNGKIRPVVSKIG